jgi:hypothetical protein
MSMQAWWLLTLALQARQFITGHETHSTLSVKLTKTAALARGVTLSLNEDSRPVLIWSSRDQIK